VSLQDEEKRLVDPIKPTHLFCFFFCIFYFLFFFFPERAVGVLMSPPVDANKKRSRLQTDVQTAVESVVESSTAVNEATTVTTAINDDDNDADQVDQPRPVFASPLRPAKPSSTATTAAAAAAAASDLSVDATASAVAAAANAATSATAAAAAAPPPRRRVARNLNFAGATTEPTTEPTSNNSNSSGANVSVTPPSQLPASITTRAAHSPHSPYRQPTLESHGNAPASLLDLFSPPAKAAPPSDDEVSGSQIGRQSLRRSLTRRMSGRLGATETLSESLENEPATVAVHAPTDDDDDDDEDVDEESFAVARDASATIASADAQASSADAGTQAAELDTGAGVGSSEASQGAASEDSGDEEAEFDPYLFIAQLPPLPEEARPRHPVLPARKAGDDRPTLVLDLDETLVHCSIDALENADFSFPVVFNDVEYKVYVRQRPHFVQFLRDVIAYGFEIVVFTASQRVYADALLHLLDPSGELIEQRLFRDSCVQVAGNFIKDLSVLGRDLARMAIIDNSPQTFGYQLDNGIPIESWFEDSADTALLAAVAAVAQLGDVRRCAAAAARSFSARQHCRRQAQAAGRQSAILLEHREPGHADDADAMNFHVFARFEFTFV
jgi:CTD small phosphatase-like protein 2